MTLFRTVAAATLACLGLAGQSVSMAITRDVEWKVQGPFAIQVYPYADSGEERWWTKVVKDSSGNDILVSSTEPGDIFTHDPESFRIFLKGTKKGNGLINPGNGSHVPLSFTEEQPGDTSWQFEQLSPPSSSTFLVKKGSERQGVHVWHSEKPDNGSFKPIIYEGKGIALRLVPEDELPSNTN